MARRFYFSTLARRPMTLGGYKITFLVSSISGGSAAGVYATEDAGEISVLDDAVRGRRGVSSITEEEYNDAAKKAKATRLSSNTSGSFPRLVRAPISPPIGIEERTGVAVPAGAKPAQPQETIFKGPHHNSLPGKAALMQGLVQRVNPPKPFAASEAKTAKASERATRAKVRIARAAVT